MTPDTGFRTGHSALRTWHESKRFLSFATRFMSKASLPSRVLTNSGAGNSVQIHSSQITQRREAEDEVFALASGFFHTPLSCQLLKIHINKVWRHFIFVYDTLV